MKTSKVGAPVSPPSSTYSAPGRTLPKTLLSKLAGLFIDALDGDAVSLRPSALEQRRRLQLDVSCRFPTQTEVQFTLQLDDCDPMTFSLGSTHAREDLLDLRRLLNSGPNSVSPARHERVEEVRTKLESAVGRCPSLQSRVVAIKW